MKEYYAFSTGLLVLTICSGLLGWNLQTKRLGLIIVGLKQELANQKQAIEEQKVADAKQMEIEQAAALQSQDQEWRKRLIEAGFAEYHAKTGEWGLRTPQAIAGDLQLLPVIDLPQPKEARRANH